MHNKPTWEVARLPIKSQTKNRGPRVVHGAYECDRGVQSALATT